jgi:YihY family inner membrane protein
MVGFNMVLALFPFALLVLFVFGEVLKSPDVQASVLLDLKRIFPNVDLPTLQHALDRIRGSSTTLGLVAAVGGIWIGASFWGAMDTAFCRIYHVECRGWVEQKRFALGMLAVVVLLLAASVILPTAESMVVSSTHNLPFGLDQVEGLVNALIIAGALFLTFCLCSVIYWAVPKGHMPWKAVWAGSLFVTVTTGIANWAFPVYLTNFSVAGKLGATVGFVVITLGWFYAISLALMAGAVINALRHELHDTGSLEGVTEPMQAPTA